MQQKRTDYVISCTDHAFGLAILGGGMGAREAINYAIVGEEGAERRIDEFATVIALHALNESVELSVDVR